MAPGPASLFLPLLSPPLPPSLSSSFLFLYTASSLTRLRGPARWAAATGCRRQSRPPSRTHTRRAPGGGRRFLGGCPLPFLAHFFSLCQFLYQFLTGQGRSGENAISTWPLAAQLKLPEIAASYFQKRRGAKLTAPYFEFPSQNTRGDKKCRPQTPKPARGQNCRGQSSLARWRGSGQVEIAFSPDLPCPVRNWYKNWHKEKKCTQE